MTQCETILRYMQEHPEGITPIDALYVASCLRLSARISDLRAEGYDIVTEIVKPTGYARYRLKEDK